MSRDSAELLSTSPELAPRRKSDLTRERLILAAAKVVGRLGYDKASSARIAQEAGIAAGGLYYHFENRQALLEELLPTLGKHMVAFVVERIAPMSWGLDREVAGFRAYLEYLADNPEFYRVFTEARVYAPAAYARNFAATLRDFEGALRAQRRHGFLKAREEDLPLAAHFLTGIRNYVSQMYFDANPPRSMNVDDAVNLYRQLLSEGLFRT
ncbi:TetR/AcrR family transcriptional regulator [Caenimonas sp. SL110]|uniref:TetR/AcrR family transcriptional regulator n=1 Tax=Caenimonas sp. SL110 TaxID=1450524 RepID=UPI00069F3E3C|nr:TetR/AcrR family transcriptional regulator [Caenimonas sp. SL110]